ncbi:MAG: hypothetical protein AB8I08_05735 [Sandaracinaceae bacterium]
MILPGPEISTRAMVRDALGSLDGVWFASQCHDVIRSLQDGVRPVALVVHLDTVGSLTMIQRIQSHDQWRTIPIFTLAGQDAMAVIRAIQAGARASFSAPYKGLTEPVARAAGVTVRSISGIPPRRKTPAKGMKRSS